MKSIYFINKIKNMDFILFCILILTTILYLYNLGYFPLTPDESIYTSQSAILAGQNEPKQNFISYSRSATNFQIHQYITSIFIREYGISEYTARIPTVFMGILSVLFIYIISKQLFNRRVALFSSLFLGINSYSLHFNRQINLDTPLVFFMLLSIIFMIEWKKTRNQCYFYLFLIFVILSSMSKVIIIIPLTIIIIIYLYTEKEHKNVLNMLLKPISVLVIFISIYYMYYFIINIVGIDDFIKTLIYASGRKSTGTSIFYIQIIFLFFGYIFPIITTIGLFIAIKYKTIGDIFILICFTTILLFFTLYPLRGYNYIFPIIPFLCILYGRTIDKIIDNIKKSNIKIIILLLILILSIYPSFNMFNEPDRVVHSIAPVRFDSIKYGVIQNASLWLKNNTHSDSKVAVYTFANSHVVGYYSKLKTYSIINYPGYYTPSEDGINNGYAKMNWNTTNVFKMIKDGKIDYIIYMKEPKIMENIKVFYDDDNIMFLDVYNKSYNMPEWYGKKYLNITIFEVKKLIYPIQDNSTNIMLNLTSDYIKNKTNVSEETIIVNTRQSLLLYYFGNISETYINLSNSSSILYNSTIIYNNKSIKLLWMGVNSSMDSEILNFTKQGKSFILINHKVSYKYKFPYVEIFSYANKYKKIISQDKIGTKYEIYWIN